MIGSRGSQLGPWVYEDFLIFSPKFWRFWFFLRVFDFYYLSHVKFKKIFWDFLWFFLWFFGGCTKIFWVANPSDLRRHIETAGHQVELCPHVALTSTSARGYLHKMGSRFRTWNKRWFVSTGYKGRSFISPIKLKRANGAEHIFRFILIQNFNNFNIWY